MSVRDQIVELALQLDAPDRAYVADQLEQSLSGAAEGRFKASAEWSAEIDRRISAYERGEMKSLSFEESIKSLRASLAARKSRAAQQ